MANVRGTQKNTNYKESYQHRYNCHYCSKTFADGSFRNYHERLHTETGPTYNCDECSYTTTYKKYLARHKKTHIPGSNFICTVCNKAFRKQEGLTNHLRLHTGEKPYKCEICDKAFTARYSWKTHMYIHSDEKPYSCSYCPYACRDSSSLRKHENAHTGIKAIYECGVCHKSFRLTKTLKVHMNEVHLGLNVRTFSCEHCTKAFKTRATLRNHIQLVHEKLFQCECPICGRKIKASQNLDTHLKRHINIRPYSCTYAGCKKTFITQHDASRHIITHYPSRQFLCNLCGRRFSRRWRLTAHRNTHGETYECYHCGQCFHGKISLARHMHKKHDVFERVVVECDLCGLTLYSKTDLIDHIKTEHSDEEKLCKLCNTVIEGKYYLKHLIVTHNISHKYTMKRNSDPPKKRLEGDTKNIEDDTKSDILASDPNLGVSRDLDTSLDNDDHNRDEIEQSLEELLYNIKRCDSIDEDMALELNASLNANDNEFSDDNKGDFGNEFYAEDVKVATDDTVVVKQELAENDSNASQDVSIDNAEFVDVELKAHHQSSIAQDSISVEGSTANSSILKPPRPRDPNKSRLKPAKNTVRFVKRTIKSLPNPELDLALDMAFESVTNLVPERDDSVVEEILDIPEPVHEVKPPLIEEDEVEFKPKRRRRRVARLVKDNPSDIQATEPPEDSEIIEIPMKNSILEPVSDRLRDPDSSDNVIEYSEGVLSEDISLSIARRDGRKDGEPEHALDKLFIDHAMEEPAKNSGRRTSSRSVPERSSKFTSRLKRTLSLNEGSTSKSYTSPAKESERASSGRRSTHVKRSDTSVESSKESESQKMTRTRGDKVTIEKDCKVTRSMSNNNRTSDRTRDLSRGRNNNRTSEKINEKVSRKVSSDSSSNGRDNKGKRSKLSPGRSDRVSRGANKTSSQETSEKLSLVRSSLKVTPVRSSARVSRDRITEKVSSDRMHEKQSSRDRSDNVPSGEINDIKSNEVSNSVSPKVDEVSEGANEKVSQVKTDAVSPQSVKDNVSQVRTGEVSSEKVPNSESILEYSQHVLRQDIARSVCSVDDSAGAEGALDYLFIRHVMGPGTEKTASKEKNDFKGEVCADKVRRVNKIIKKMKMEVRARKEMAALERVRRQYNARIQAAITAANKKEHVHIKYFKNKTSKDNDETNNTDTNKDTNDKDVTNDKNDDRSDGNDKGNDDGSQNDDQMEDGRSNARKINFHTHQCYICFKLFKTKLELTEHCKDHFDICNDVMLKKCPYCGHVTNRALGPHLKDKHDIVLHINYANIFEDHNYLGSKYNVKIEKNVVLEIIPSVKNLNRQAFMKIDAQKRDVKNKALASRKLVRKDKEWVVETEKIKVDKSYLLPEFSVDDYKELKIEGDTYEYSLKKLGLLAKKKGVKILYPCVGCEKLCQNLSALILHNRKHQKNPKPFKPKVWKARQVKSKVNKKVKSTVKIRRANDLLKDNRYGKPKPVVNKHKCDEELIKFYENNIRGSDIEFWQFLKIYNRMTKENVKDFEDLETRNDNTFGIHIPDEKNKPNKDSENNVEDNDRAENVSEGDGATVRKRRKISSVKRPTLLSKKERDRRNKIKMELRKKFESTK